MTIPQVRVRQFITVTQTIQLHSENSVIARITSAQLKNWESSEVPNQYIPTEKPCKSKITVLAQS
jgi:uncharacterized protein (DUF427 family)